MTALLNLSSRAFHEDVHGHLARMRREAPVCRVRMTRWDEAYVIARYADVDATLRGAQLVKDPANIQGRSGRGQVWMPKTFRALLGNMLKTDEPDHRRLRALVQQAFTPRRIAGLTTRVEAIAEELLAEARGDIDLVQAFAWPLPVRVIAELIGVPPRDERRFWGWTRRVACVPTPLNLLRAVPSLRRLLRYIRELADARARDPRDDLITALVQAEEQGDRLSRDELVATVFLLLLAGHETTVGLITNGVRALLEHPDQLARLRDDPGLIESAIEEMLRFDGPLVTTEMYYAREPITLRDVTIPAGAVVLPAILSANRDEEAFERPDVFDITRSPNRHLAFGKGLHFCLGAALARLEARIAITALLRRAPGLRLTAQPGELRHVRVPILNKIEALPVRV